PEGDGAAVVGHQPLVVPVEVVASPVDRRVDPGIGHGAGHARVGPGPSAVAGTGEVGVDEEIVGIVATVEVADVDLSRCRDRDLGLELVLAVADRVLVDADRAAEDGDTGHRRAFVDQDVGVLAAGVGVLVGPGDVDGAVGGGDGHRGQRFIAEVVGRLQVVRHRIYSRDLDRRGEGDPVI